MRLVTRWSAGLENETKIEYDNDNGWGPGSRVELSHATDRWMMGDRFGTITRVDEKKNRIKVHLDVSGKSLWFAPDYVLLDN